MTTEATIREQKLAEEILESQKVRSSLLQWKLIITAALGAAGLGLTKESGGPTIGLLALIPLVCVYVDLLCTNLNLRIILIGQFFANERKDPYETKAREAGEKLGWYELEDWALYWSTHTISAILVVITLANLLIAYLPRTTPPWCECWPHGAILFTCVLGAVLTRITRKAARKKIEASKQSIEKAAMHLRHSVPVIHNENLRDYIRSSYRRKDIERLQDFLVQKGTLRFRCLDNGLFPAASSATDDDASGYQNAWVRDNVHIAHAHFTWGDRDTAARSARALMRFFQDQRQRMRQVIQSPSLAADPMKRPHVRFDARTMKELAQKWPHAQNDALGYFLWFYSKMARAKLVKIQAIEMETLADLVLYFRAIKYWKDRDSGHWEEARKTSASSIGTVLAGLREFERLCARNRYFSSSALDGRGINAQWLDRLCAKGEKALRKILPHESLGPGKKNRRRYDAALLFLIYPLDIVPPETASLILDDVVTQLIGPVGIRRYLGDSYWCGDYRGLFALGDGSDDFSDDLQSRDHYLKPGQEAQWCLFDPIIACIHARRVLAQPDNTEARMLQTHYLNRSLGQLTQGHGSVPDLQCPEAYFLENGAYVPNDHVPLQWAQANLGMALHWLKMTVES